MEDVVIMQQDRPEGKGTIFRAVTSTNIDRKYTLPSHKTEKGFVSDHIVTNPHSLSLHISLFEDEVQVLRDLYDKKALLTVTTATDHLTDMVIESMKIVEAGSNVFKASVEVQQIRQTQARIVATSLTFLTPESQANGSQTAVDPLEKSTTNAPELSDQSSYLDWVLGGGGE